MSGDLSEIGVRRSNGVTYLIGSGGRRRWIADSALGRAASAVLTGEPFPGNHDGRCRSGGGGMCWHDAVPLLVLSGLRGWRERKS